MHVRALFVTPSPSLAPPSCLDLFFVLLVKIDMHACFLFQVLSLRQLQISYSALLHYIDYVDIFV